MTQLPSPRWSEDQLRSDAGEATAIFREQRMHEPLEQYLDHFDRYRAVVENLLEGTVDLTRLVDQAVDLLTDPAILTVVRYLASPFISEDDLKVLADDASLAPTRLRAEPEMARRVVGTVLLGLGRDRFPWVSESREPTDAEREVAVVATASLIATQKTQTARRNDAKTEQEEAVAAALLQHDFVEVPTRDIRNFTLLPEPGQFCRESLFGTRKADLVVRLWDGRAMPIECKVSNSSTNSVKRLNNDAAVKAKLWIEQFGTTSTVPAAVLSGVFKVHNLETAQSDGLSIFWAHKLQALVDFVSSAR